MSSLVKTTVDIAASLLLRAKAIARRDRTTLRALIEEGLRLALAARRRSGGFALRDASVGGSGLQPGVAAGDWPTVRDAGYRGRGT